MKKTWISERRTIQLPGLTVDRHLSAPNELEFPGCNQHLLCLLLSDGNQQKITRIGEQESKTSQVKGSFWICPAQVSGLWAWNSTDQSLMFVIDPLLLNQAAEEVGGLDANKLELLSTISANDSQITAIARFFQAELDTFGIGGQLYAESLMQVFIVHLLRHYCAFQPILKSYTGGLAPSQLRLVLDYMHAHFSEDLSLQAIAQQLHLSSHYFGRLFRQSTGKTPHQYVTECRLERAKQLLKQTNLQVVEVAAEVGFRSQSHFTTVFKEQMRTTPLQFRKALRP